MKKTLGLASMTALALINTSHAGRIQYSMDDAIKASKKEGNNFVWTFSDKVQRAKNTKDETIAVAEPKPELEPSVYDENGYDQYGNWACQPTHVEASGMMRDRGSYMLGSYLGEDAQNYLSQVSPENFASAALDATFGALNNIYASGQDPSDVVTGLPPLLTLSMALGGNVYEALENAIGDMTDEDYYAYLTDAEKADLEEKYSTLSESEFDDYVNNVRSKIQNRILIQDLYPKVENEVKSYMQGMFDTYCGRVLYADGQLLDPITVNNGEVTYNGGGKGDCSYTQTSCYMKGTPITLADGSTKKAEDITYDDELLVWNFDEGKFGKAKPIWIQVPRVAEEYNYIRFSDGSVLNTINQHRILNIESGKFTYPMTDDTPIGTHTLNAKGEIVTVVEKKVVKEKVTYYNIITFGHINCFASNICTSCRLNNIYPIKDLKFVKDDRELIPYSQFSKIDRRWYDGLRLAEQPSEINRGRVVNFGDKTVEDYVLRLISMMQPDESLSSKAC